ncbi:hypothetical protein J2744_002930 [Halorubrum trapanicum]|jgi:hypothetical protein|uniref:Uncharacterized protein n=2 Tax=Halorubrum TaxID=56688 RepID=A0A256IRZ4_9EURY|nr:MULTISPECIES: hypothetical protein [Halorubrum]MBP1903226.1 hypothetical protein [Halorubrum trapanicum]OYR58912.1 hypothetical protein DJ70_01835 [Halorubrum halodurans]
MIRILIGVLGAVTTLFPDKIVALFEKHAITNPSEGTLRKWVNPAIRSEGILIVVISLLGSRLYAWMMNLTGAFGAAVLMFPDLYRKFASTVLYERPDAIEWNEQFTTGVRVIGAVYVFLGAKTYRDRHKET